MKIVIIALARSVDIPIGRQFGPSIATRCDSTISIGTAHLNSHISLDNYRMIILMIVLWWRPMKVRKGLHDSTVNCRY